MGNPKSSKERLFSIELKSKAHIKNFTLMNNSPEEVLIEGLLGKLERARFAEGVILEVVGSNGVLRVDIGEDEIKKTQLNNEKRGETTQ